jgi:acetamidase/formamidase
VKWRLEIGYSIVTLGSEKREMEFFLKPNESFKSLIKLAKIELALKLAQSSSIIENDDAMKPDAYFFLSCEVSFYIAILNEHDKPKTSHREK